MGETHASFYPAHEKGGQSQDQPPHLCHASVSVCLLARTGTIGDFHPAVLKFTHAIGGFNARGAFTKSLSGNHASRNALAFKIGANRSVATLGKTHIILGLARFIGVAGQHDLRLAAICISRDRIVEDR